MPSKIPKYICPECASWKPGRVSKGSIECLKCGYKAPAVEFKDEADEWEGEGVWND